MSNEITYHPIDREIDELNKMVCSLEKEIDELQTSMITMAKSMERMLVLQGAQQKTIADMKNTHKEAVTVITDVQIGHMKTMCRTSEDVYVRLHKLEAFAEGR